MKTNQHSIKLDIEESQCIEMKSLRLLKKFLIVTTYQKLTKIAPKFLLELSPVLKILMIDQNNTSPQKSAVSDGQSCDAVSDK